MQAQVASLLLIAILGTSSFAQTEPSTQSPVPAQSNQAPFVLGDGAPVKLRINRTMSSADAKTGETVDFDVLEDVKVNGIAVVPSGGIAWATVTEAQPKRRVGRGGKLSITIDSVRLMANS